MAGNSWEWQAHFANDCFAAVVALLVDNGVLSLAQDADGKAVHMEV